MKKSENRKGIKKWRESGEQGQKRKMDGYEEWYWSVALFVMRLPASSPLIGQLHNSEHAFPQSLRTTSIPPCWFTTLWLKTVPAGMSNISINSLHIYTEIFILRQFVLHRDGIYSMCVCSVCVCLCVLIFIAACLTVAVCCGETDVWGGGVSLCGVECRVTENK